MVSCATTILVLGFLEAYADHVVPLNSVVKVHRDGSYPSLKERLVRAQYAQLFLALAADSGRGGVRTMVVFMIDIDVALVNGLGYTLHWQRRRQYRSSREAQHSECWFGVAVILTNAHCIEWHAQVKVQQRGQDTKYLARVVSVGWEADCAVLTVEAAGNWAAGQGKGTLEFSVSICAACFLYTAAKEVDDDSDEEQEKISDLREAAFTEVQLSKKVPHLEEHVLCVGFPVGGDTISVTSGVVSRVEVMTYAPALECTLLEDHPFQSLSSDQAENIGYVIPTVVIMHFLSDLLKHNG
ncbi:Protease Do-like 9, partial [Symbiodinium microadriaticum]